MKLAIFDFDGTLLERDTLPCLGDSWLKQNRSRIRYLQIYCTTFPLVLFYKLKLIDKPRLKKYAVQRFNMFFKGMSKKEIEDFFTITYRHIERLFNKEVVTEIARANDEGFHTVLLSGAYYDLLKVVAANLEIRTVIGVQLPYRKGFFDHGKMVTFVGGREKLNLLQKRFAGQSIDWQKSRSYGDSITDLPVLDIVGEPVAVKPDKDLLNYAQKNNWRIIAS